MIRVGFLFTRMRVEEKKLLEELESRPNIEIVPIDDGQTYFDLGQKTINVDVVFERSLSYSRGLYISRIFEAQGVPVVNSSLIAERCGDKYMTSQILMSNGIPTPRVIMAFDEQSALQAVDAIGYPCVLKPVIGSWGRLLAKVDDRETAEAIIEHKATLGGVNHQVFYIQEYIHKPGRDIRAFVIGEEPLCAIYRSSENWITNTARGATTSNCPVTKELHDISVRAAQAVGGGVVAIDVFETQEGLSINEVNYTMEFRNSIDVTGVNIPAKVVDYVLEAGRK
jgi:[lysine-biosynthesis-protein LysW]--L-2-aminoadipate ligase